MRKRRLDLWQQMKAPVQKGFSSIRLSTTTVTISTATATATARGADPSNISDAAADTCAADDDGTIDILENDGRSKGILATIADYFITPNDDDNGNNDGNGNGNNTVSSHKSPSRKRGNIRLVAGSGKTYIAWKTIEGLLTTKCTAAVDRRPKIALFVTPYLKLVDQALDNKDRHGILTDNTTLIVASKTSRKEVCTTDVEKIADFFANNENENENELKLVVCTYNSLPKIGTAIHAVNSDSSCIIDFAIFDEAHRMEGFGKTTGSGGFWIWTFRFKYRYPTTAFHDGDTTQLYPNGQNRESGGITASTGRSTDSYSGSTTI